MKVLNIICCVTATLLLSSCIDNYVSLEVLGAKPWEVTEEACLTPAPGLEIQNMNGWIDFEENYNTFIQPFEIRNNLPKNDDIPGRLDTNSVTFDRMIVSYRGLPEQPDVTTRLQDLDTVVYLTAVVESAGGVVVIPLTLIPSFRGQAIQSALVASPGSRATIIASFYLEGRTNAGSPISTATIDYPINIGYQSGICDGGICACYRHK